MKLIATDYRQAWDQILPALTKTLKRFGNGLRPEDVYCDLRMGMAALYLCEDGFIIFKVSTNAVGQRELLVNWAYSHSREKVIAKYSDDIDCIARELNCKTESMITSRRGYERALPPSWRLKYYCWVRDVPGEGE